MKKNDLITVAILSIGLWAGFQAITMVLYLLTNLLTLVISDFNHAYAQKYVTNDIILFAGYFVVAWLAIKKTDQIIAWLKPEISKPVDELGEEEPKELSDQAVSKFDLMRIVLIGIGMIIMIPAFPEFLKNIFRAFQSKVNPGEDMEEPFSLAIPFLQIVFPAALIFYSKKITASLKL